MSKCLSFVLPVLALGLGACGTTRMIPNTRVPDTPENREIINVCERYRRAFEARDSATLLALASPRYFDDSGTAKPEDDYGYEGLKKILPERLARLRTLRYEIEYRRVNVNRGRAEVEVYIDASYQLAPREDMSGTDQYRHVTEYNRLKLEHDGKRWLFTSGM